MSLDELIKWSLTNEGKAALKTELEAHCQWLYHDSWQSNFARVKASGLQPRDPIDGAATPGRFQKLRQALPAMVSFAQTPNLLPSKLLDDPPLFTLALAAHDFPTMVLDWSFPDMLDRLAIEVANLDTTTVAPAVVARIAAMNGVAFVNPIPADMLRVKTVATATSPPDEWPLLAATDLKDVSLR